MTEEETEAREVQQAAQDAPIPPPAEPGWTLGSHGPPLCLQSFSSFPDPPGRCRPHFYLHNTDFDSVRPFDLKWPPLFNLPHHKQ